MVFAAFRAVGMLGPGSLRWLLPLGFVLMSLCPWLLLTAAQRRDIGLRLPRQPRFYALAILSGAAAALVCFSLGTALFGAGDENWFVSVAGSYRRVMDTSGWSMLQLHLVFTVPALIFSPIGEEIFFRGYLQYVLEQRFGAGVATVTECAAFALVHLCHHGLLLGTAGLELLPLSAAIWMVLMFGAAFLFAWLRKTSNSLLPAIVSHAVFNLVMNFTIFTYLWTAAT